MYFWFTDVCYFNGVLYSWNKYKLFEKKDACIQLKFHAICNHQVYYLHYGLKITKIYVKNNTSKNRSSIETKNRKIQFCKTLSITSPPRVECSVEVTNVCKPKVL